ncbi:MAG TPA: hypothetical protein VFC28_10985 [Opitutaceae bacterium]|nr:hypothetical protein [Opitutaceae bacterium]
MQKDDFQILRFRVFRDLRGSVQSVSGGRRNGKPAVFFPRSLAEPPDPAAEQPALCEQPRLFVNLNALERETWRKILQAQSIASIAKQEGVSRAAIYARIQGNNKGQGGMVAKNFWVLLWWLLRQRSLFQEHYD